MDAYRASLVNLQESYCYYIGVVLNNQSTVYTESGEELEIEDLDSQWMYDYGYKSISLESLDNFFMFLRTWTNNPNYNTTGSSLDIDLSVSSVLEDFIIQAMNYMCSAVGLQDPLSSLSPLIPWSMVFMVSWNHSLCLLRVLTVLSFG